MSLKTGISDRTSRDMNCCASKDSKDGFTGTDAQMSYITSWLARHAERKRGSDTASNVRQGGV